MKGYETPKMEILALLSEDIVTSSDSSVNNNVSSNEDIWPDFYN